MTDSLQNCSICSSELAVQVCLCNNQIKFLGAQCYIIHIQDLSSLHVYLPIEIGQSILQDSNNLKTYYEDRAVALCIQDDLSKYIYQLATHKERVLNYKETLLSQISQVFDEVSVWLDKQSEEVQGYNEEINQHHITAHSQLKYLINKYRSKGMSGVVCNYFREINIDVHDIMRYIKSKFEFIYQDYESHSDSIDREVESSLVNSTDDSADKLDDFITKDNALEYKYIDILNYKRIIKDQEEKLANSSQLLKNLKDQINVYKHAIYDKDIELDDLKFSSYKMENEIKHLHSYIDIIKSKSQHEVLKRDMLIQRLKADNNALKDHRNSSKQAGVMKSKLKYFRILSMKRIRGLKLQVDQLRQQIAGNPRNGETSDEH